MDLVEHLMSREKLDLAKELAQTAKDNSHLREQVRRLECQLFWLEAKPTPIADANLQQALDTIDAHRLRRQERAAAEQKYTGAEHRTGAKP